MSANLASVPQPGSVMSAEFTYESLEYAAKEIRLVEIIRQTDQVFEVRLSRYEISDAPEYNAISYTWGDGETTRMTDIIVNGQKMQVTENCRHALEQAHYQYHLPQPSRVHFWIDSICINQNSHMEKQHQVAMMGRIYAQAVRVLACVGRHQDHSEDLAGVLRNARSSFDNLSEDSKLLAKANKGWFYPPDKFKKTDVRSMVGQSLMSMGWTFDRFSETFYHFSRRYYWTRLWIIQEVSVAKRLEILCGLDSFSRSDIYILHWTAGLSSILLESELDYLYPEYRRLYASNDTDYISHFKFALDCNPNRRIPALKILTLQSPFGCSRPEDRVYGMLSLIKWPEADPPILVEPIYKPLVSFDLAELFLGLPDCGATNVVGIIKALEIYHDHERMTEILAARSFLSSTFSDCSKYSVCHYDLDTSSCRVILKSETGHLMTYLSHSSHPVVDSHRLLNVVKNAPQLLYVRSQVAAFLCSAAREGDFLVQTPFGNGLLILRYSGTPSQYHIVGQGLLLNGFYIKTKDLPYWGGKPIKEEREYMMYCFSHFLHKQASLLPKSPQRYKKDLGLCLTHLKEIYDVEVAMQDQNRKDQSKPRKRKLEIIDALQECAREIRKGRYGDWLTNYTSHGRSPVILELEPREMLFLGCQDLEKDGSRNDSKMVQRLNTTVHGRAFIKPIAKDEVADKEFSRFSDLRTHELLGASSGSEA